MAALNQPAPPIVPSLASIYTLFRDIGRHGTASASDIDAARPRGDHFRSAAAVADKHLTASLRVNAEPAATVALSTGR
jgi:hypothetical protein